MLTYYTLFGDKTSTVTKTVFFV